MTKYMALYMAPADAIAKMMKLSAEEGQAEMDAWMAWDAAHKSAIVDLGNPLGRTKRVTAGKVADGHNEVTGYSIVEADSADAAAKIFLDHPHLRMQGAWIDVLNVVNVEDMMAA